MVVLSFHIRLVCVCLCLCVDAFSRNDRCPVEDLCVVSQEEINYCVHMSVLSLRLCCCAHKASLIYRFDCLQCCF